MEVEPVEMMPSPAKENERSDGNPERGCAARAQCPSWAIELSATVTAKISTSKLKTKRHFSIIALPWRNWRPSFSAFGPESRCAQEARRCMAAALYASLNADQKRRLGSVAVRVLPELRDAFDTRRSDV
jgi:hypothetical protein